MYRYIITQSKNGYDIYINLISSPAGHYLSRRPYVINLIKEVLSSTHISGARVVFEQDMGRNIGRTDIVATSEQDTIYYAQPIKTAVFSRFVKNRYPQPSQSLTIILQQDANGDYEVHNTWIGPSSPPFPGDDHETLDSKDYWKSHALVQDAQIIQSKTITKRCPY
jgi:hypothetical protein